MQRKHGTNHADWYFFTCITKNRLGVDKCTGMYVREEDVLRAIYYQLKLYVKEHFISDSQYKQELMRLNNKIDQSTVNIKRLLEMLFVITKGLLTEKSAKMNFE